MNNVIIDICSHASLCMPAVSSLIRRFLGMKQLNKANTDVHGF